VASGWSYEGIDGSIYTYPQGTAGLVPLSRYCIPSLKWYAFAKNSTEAASLTANGFVFDKVVGYVYPDGTKGGCRCMGHAAAGGTASTPPVTGNIS